MPNRDNGFVARHYVPLADLDPRLADAMLDLLRDQAIAAYASPSTGRLGGYLEVILPERPRDRLWVDREQRDRAVELLNEHTDPESVGHLSPDEAAAAASSTSTANTANTANTATTADAANTATTADAAGTATAASAPAAAVVATVSDEATAGSPPEPEESDQWSGERADTSAAAVPGDLLDQPTPSVPSPGASQAPAPSPAAVTGTGSDRGTADLDDADLEVAEHRGAEHRGAEHRGADSGGDDDGEPGDGGPGDGPDTSSTGTSSAGNSSAGNSATDDSTADTRSSDTRSSDSRSSDTRSSDNGGADDGGEADHRDLAWAAVLASFELPAYEPPAAASTETRPEHPVPRRVVRPAEPTTAPVREIPAAGSGAVEEPAASGWDPLDLLDEHFVPPEPPPPPRLQAATRWALAAIICGLGLLIGPRLTDSMPDGSAALGVFLIIGGLVALVANMRDDHGDDRDDDGAVV